MIRASNVRVERGGKEILRGVDLEADAGEIVGVLGPSGAGKSTLFRALTGEVPPDAGTIALDGTDVARWPLWRRARAGIGYIPQSPSVLWDFTVRANLTTFANIAGVTNAASTDSLADRVGLAHRLDVRAGQLSAGERRRLEFARAIIRTPRVLVCDEPFAGVDPAGASHLGDLLEGLAKSGVSVLLADHHVAEALRICTRAVLLLDGTVAAQFADAAAFEDHPLVRSHYLASSWTKGATTKEGTKESE
jgi:lipopolysaccharide export system ATP-binding protein